MKTKILLILISVLFLTQFIMAQTAAQTLKGRVESTTGEELIGASIQIKGSGTGTITDTKGDFTLKVQLNDILVVKYIGYTDKEITVKSFTPLKVVLAEDAETLEEVVVVGYGTTRRKEITGSITSVKAEELNMVNALSIDNVLQGKAAGVVITQNSAQPAGGLSVSVRGGGTPLYVIDGVAITVSTGQYAGSPTSDGRANGDGVDRSPLASINPNDIESVEVLKDASATAIYGSQAANGVVLITTKSGKEGKMKVSISQNLSLQKVTKRWDMMGGSEYMMSRNLAEREYWLYNNRYAPYGPKENVAPDSGWATYFTDEQIKNAQTYDHLSELLRSGFTTDTNVSLSGGSEKFSYYTSLSIYSNNPILKDNNYRRYSGRINLSWKMTDWLTFKINSSYSQQESDNPSVGGSTTNANTQRQTGAAMMYAPYHSLYAYDGTLAGSDDALLPNPLAWHYMDDHTTTKRFMVSPILEAKLMKNLKLTLTGGVDELHSVRGAYSPSISKMPENSTYDNYGGYYYSDSFNSNLEAFANYDVTFNEKHRLSVVAGAGYYLQKTIGFNVTEAGFFSDVFGNNNLGAVTDRSLGWSGSWRWEGVQLSQFGRLNYTFLDRYILGFNIRRDGSSGFPAKHKWGVFPGVSAAWLVSSEPFMANNAVFDLLKVRVGWGSVGNAGGANGGRDPSLSYYGLNSEWLYKLGDKLYNGVGMSTLGNENLKWETITTTNIGVDMAMFKNRLNVTLDLYSRTRKDIHSQITLAPTAPVGSYTANVGSQVRYGYDLDIKGTIIEKRDFKLGAYFNLSWSIGKWLKRNPEDIAKLYEWEKEKDWLGVSYGWKSAGLFQSYEDVQAWKSQGNVLQPNATAGQIKYQDINNDGVLDAKDVVRLGIDNPYFFGFGIDMSYKNFDLNVGTYGKFNYFSWNGWSTFSSISTLRSGNNQSKHISEVWTSYQTDGNLTGIATAATYTAHGGDDYNRRNTYFWRIKNVTVGYTLPKIKGLGNCRVYVDFNNLGTLTNNRGLDVEMENNASPYPIPFTASFGFNLNF